MEIFFGQCQHSDTRDQAVLSPRPAEFSPGPAAVETIEKCSLPSLQPLLHLNEIHSIYIERMRTVGDCV